MKLTSNLFDIIIRYYNGINEGYQMQTLNFNLRGINPTVMAMLKREAEKQHTSINLLILKCIEQGVGFSHKVNRPIFNDLDHLAGTWKKEDLKAFKKNIQHFEKIDKDLWS
jgi:hypothetical protein